MIKGVIIAGGKGARLGKITEKIPKPMVKIGNFPVLMHQINLLKRYNIKDIIVLTGYRAEIIENYFKNKKIKGVKITCLKSKVDIGQADRVKLAEKRLTDDFIVFFGDIMLDMDLQKLIDFHKKKNSFCTLVLHPNDHPHDSDLVEINDNNKIVAFHLRPREVNQYFTNLVNSGIYVMSPKIFKYIKSKACIELNFDKHIFSKIFKKENLFGYNTPEYIKDMGTPKRLKEVTKDYLDGKIKRFNIKNKRKAIFLDRDGVINYDPGNLYDINKFKLLHSVAKAIKLINASEYLAILTSNQPVVAKGLIDVQGAEKINKKMETLLGKEGAKLDAIYFCPHHPDKGYPGENSQYAIQCGCRKPQPGMIKKAQKDLNIDLTKSWTIGNSERDIIAGASAKVKTILVKKNQEKFEKCRIKPTKKANDLYSAVKLILKQK